MSGPQAASLGVPGGDCRRLQLGGSVSRQRTDNLELEWTMGILCGVPSAMAVLLCRLAKSWGEWTVKTHAAASLLAECTNHSIATCKWSRSMPDDEVIRRLWRASCSDRILANDGQHQFIPKSANTMSFLASCHTQPLFQYSCIGDADF